MVSLLVVCLHSLNSHMKVFFILLPKGARRHTSSTAPDLSKKEFKKEKERLTTELHLLIQLRNEQRDHLIDFKESSNYNRYALLQTLWCQSGVFNVSLIISFIGGGFYEAVPPDRPYAQPHVHECFIAERQNLKLGQEGDEKWTLLIPPIEKKDLYSE